MKEQCPYCNCEFDVEVWEDGKCPNCKAEFVWDTAPLICWKRKSNKSVPIAVLPLKDIWKNEN
jgi:predicted Zn-ribbon and HTH transcriptional regulator